MTTPTLDRFFNRWAFYKRMMIIFFAVNVFSVVAALVLGINFFIFKGDIGDKQTGLFQRIESIDTALSNLSSLQAELQRHTDNTGKITIKTREDETKILDILDRWQTIKNSLKAIDDVHFNTNTRILLWSKESENEFQTLSRQLEELKVAAWQSARALFKEYNDTSRLLIITGVLTLVFGVLLPSLLMYLMGRALNHIRKEIQNTALTFVKTWTETQAGFGEEAFKNVEFWLQILLLVGSYGNRVSSHPAAQITSELAHVVRLELLKQKERKTAA